MSQYEPGDVVWCNYPFNDARLKPRPGLVIGTKPGSLYVISQITTTDRHLKNPGELIPGGTTIQKLMGLDKPSFINLGNIKILPISFIVRKMGRYEPWDEFEERFAQILAKALVK